MKNAIYTHDEAAIVIEKFEDILTEHNIRVPSPEDDERDPDDTGLYGSVYSELLDDIEIWLVNLLHRRYDNTLIIVDTFSGDF